MIPTAIILALLLLQASALDFSYQSKKVVLQLDMDTVVIHTKIEPVRLQLIDLQLEISSIKRAVMTETLNSLKGKDEHAEMSKIIIGILNVLSDSVEQAISDIDHIFVDYDSKEKRALEILGDFLSTCTGVPSAREHRKLMEQVKMLELDSRSLANLMGESSDRQEKVIQAMQTHEARIIKADRDIQINSFKILQNQKKSIKLAAAASIIAKTNEVIRNAMKATDSAYDILESSNSKQLSIRSIDSANLSHILDNIYLQRRKTETAPIFSGEDSYMYYEMPVTHSWAIKEGREIASLLQIPVAKINTDHELEILDPLNILRPDLTLAVVSKSTNTYRYLSDSDFHRCMQTRDIMICQKRNIVIQPRQGCILREANCADWADIIVHDVSNSQILISGKESQNATLSCNNKIDHITIPNSAILTLPVSCSLHSPRFQVGKLSFAHLADINRSLKKSGNQDLTFETDLFKIAHDNKLNVTEKNATINLAELKKENELFSEKLSSYQKHHDEMWSAIDGGRTGWEQLLFYGLFGALGFLILAAYGWILKLQIASWKRKGERGQDALTKEQIVELKQRISDLETDLEIMNIRRGARAPEPQPPKYEALAKQAKQMK